MPPSRPPPAKAGGRRGFLKILLILTAGLTIIPFVPWGDFLQTTVGGKTDKTKAVRAVVDNDRKAWGTAAGQPVDVTNLTIFPPNSHWTITYPSSGNLLQDSQNPDTFVKWDLIRLPTALGGDQKSATAFVAFSKVCVHLWCSPSYHPDAGHMDYECPCHGSIYEVPDGKAVQGPASLQPAPTNAIPMLSLTTDLNGILLIQPFNPTKDQKDAKGNPLNLNPTGRTDVQMNGVLGYGRDYHSYEEYILQVAEGKIRSGGA